MKRIVAVTAGISWFLAGFTSYAQQTTAAAFNLKHCIETGISNSLDVNQSGLDMQRSRINWNQAKLNMLPDLNGTASTGVNQGRSIDPFTNGYINQQVNYSSYGISSGVVLFNGLSMQHTVKQNALAYEASKMDWQQAKDDLTINIILAYLQVLANEDLLVQARNQADLSKKQVERLEIMNKEGAILPSQLYDLKGQYAGDQVAIINAQNALALSKNSLCRLMNIPYDKNMKLERIDAESYAVKYEDSPDKIYQESLQKFSLIKAADLRRQSAAIGVKAVKGLLYPVLVLGGNANTNYSSAARNDIFLGTSDVTTNDYVMVNGTPSPVIRKQSNFQSEKIGYNQQLNNNLFTSVNLSLRIPLFNSWQVRNRIKLAQLTLKNNDMAAATAKTQLQQAVEQAYITMTSASERFKVLMEQAHAYSESFRTVDIRFNAGLGNSIDYLTAKNNLDRSNINLINAKYEYVLRTRVLDYYQGKQLW
ncbi:MAG: TolC family protein [Chitinophagaceae bacterium]|nr:TolC family protein [Chitinophagaceae bacterium]